jgi:hypothetical protein
VQTTRRHPRGLRDLAELQKPVTQTRAAVCFTLQGAACGLTNLVEPVGSDNVKRGAPRRTIKVEPEGDIEQAPGSHEAREPSSRSRIIGLGTVEHAGQHRASGREHGVERALLTDWRLASRYSSAVKREEVDRHSYGPGRRNTPFDAAAGVRWPRSGIRAGAAASKRLGVMRLLPL